MVLTAGIMKTNTDGQEGYSAWPAYGRSKLANLLFTYELDRRLRGAGLSAPTVIVAHPGLTDTNLFYLDKSAFVRGAFGLMNSVFSQSVQYGGIP